MFHISTAAYITRMDFGESGLQHIDNNDMDGAFEVTFGDYTGGSLVWPTLKLKTTMRPGDLVWFNSAELPHYVETVNMGCRFALVFATHHNTVAALEKGIEPRDNKKKTKPSSIEKECSKKSVKLFLEK